MKEFWNTIQLIFAGVGGWLALCTHRFCGH